MLFDPHSGIISISRIAFACFTTLLLCTPTSAQETDSAEIDVIAAAVGEVLAMDDLCRWDLKSKIDQKLKAAAVKLRLSASQQQQAQARIDTEKALVFGNVSAAGRERMRADICTAESRVRIENMVTQFSFD